MNVSRRSFIGSLAGIGFSLATLPSLVQEALADPADFVNIPDEVPVSYANNIDGSRVSLYMTLSGIVHGPASIFDIIVGESDDYIYVPEGDGPPPPIPYMHLPLMRGSTKDTVLCVEKHPHTHYRWCAPLDYEIFVPEADTVFFPSITGVASAIYYKR